MLIVRLLKRVGVSLIAKARLVPLMVDLLLGGMCDLAQPLCCGLCLACAQLLEVLLALLCLGKELIEVLHRHLPLLKRHRELFRVSLLRCKLRLERGYAAILRGRFGCDGRETERKDGVEEAA